MEKKPSVYTAPILAVLLVLVIGFIVCVMAGGIRERSAVAEARAAVAETAAPPDLQREAWYAAWDNVAAQLKSPSTAHFGGKVVTRLSPDTYRVQGWVDSQNSFGATLRSYFQVNMRYRDGSWVAYDGFLKQR